MTNWYKQAQLIESFPYFEQLGEDYIPDEVDINYRLGELGLSIISKIDSGDSGVAYLLSSNDVLKITTNDQEGKVAQYLMDNPSPYIVDYRYVWKLGNLYYIIMEQVDPLSDDLEDIFDKLHWLQDKNFCYNPGCSIDILKKDPYFNSLDNSFTSMILDYLLHLKNIPIKIFDFLNSTNIGTKNGTIKFFDIT
jgi:hypothetical protein